LFKIVKRSYNKAFGVDIIPNCLGARVESHALGAYKIIMEGEAVEGFYGSSKRGSFDWKCIALVFF